MYKALFRSAPVGSRSLGLSLALAVTLAVALPEDCLRLATASTLSLNFGSAVSGTVQDASGNGTGFPTRMPATGSAYPTTDSSLALNTGSNNLTFTVNQGADGNGPTNAATMEALGVQLNSLGFTGSQDFSVTATFTFPTSGVNSNYDQFGVYVGSSITQETRGGFVNVGGQSAFGTSDPSGSDTGSTLSAQTFFAGDSITTTISRTGGVLTETVADTTAGHAFSVDVTPSLAPGSFLNSLGDLNVGVFATNGGIGAAFTVPLTSFNATVLTTAQAPEPATVVLLGLAAVALAFCRLRRSGS